MRRRLVFTLFVTSFGWRSVRPKFIRDNHRVIVVLHNAAHSPVPTWGSPHVEDMTQAR